VSNDTNKYVKLVLGLEKQITRVMSTQPHTSDLIKDRFGFLGKHTCQLCWHQQTGHAWREVM